MKKLMKPSRSERQIIERAGLDAREWLIERKNHEEMKLVSRDRERTQTIELVS